MGADLTMTYLWTTRPPGRVDWAAARRAVEALTLEELEEWGYIDADPATLRSDVLDGLSQVRAMWDGQLRRDVDRLRIGDLRMLVTGGMSGGDDPTDAYGVISSVPEPVLRAAGFWDTPDVSAGWET